jgi:methylase of polypeptide subunit release factors
MNRPLYRAFLKLFAREIVTAAYAGLLRRAPSASELASHSAELKRTGSVENLLESVSRSDELWRRLMAEHADDLVKVVFRAVLGREPEDEALRAYSRTLADKADLEPVLADVVASHEHRRQVLRGAASDEIQTEASEQQLDQCIAKVGETWARLGAARPHFSVLTDAVFLPESIHENIESFWQSGEIEAEWIGEMLRQHGFGDRANGNCVEYGCGVGRVTMALARRFARVDAYDVSAGHLALANERARELGLSNVSFHQRTSALAPLASCHFFYSKIVFQHNPPPLIGQLIRLSLRTLVPDGVAIFQLPIHSPGYRFNLSEWLRQASSEDMEMHCFPLDQVLKIVAAEGCTTLEVREDHSCGEQYVSRIFVVRKHR